MAIKLTPTQKARKAIQQNRRSNNPVITYHVRDSKGNVIEKANKSVQVTKTTTKENNAMDATQVVNLEIENLLALRQHGALTGKSLELYEQLGGKIVGGTLGMGGKITFSEDAVKQRIKAKQQMNNSRVHVREARTLESTARNDLIDHKKKSIQVLESMGDAGSPEDVKSRKNLLQAHTDATAAVEKAEKDLEELQKQSADLSNSTNLKQQIDSQEKALKDARIKESEALDAIHQYHLNSEGVEEDVKKESKKFHEALTDAEKRHSNALEIFDEFRGISRSSSDSTTKGKKKSEETTITDDVKGFFGDVWNFMKTNNLVKFGGISAATLFVIKFIMDQLNLSSNNSQGISPEALAALSQMPNANSGLTTASLQGAR